MMGRIAAAALIGWVITWWGPVHAGTSLVEASGTYEEEWYQRPVVRGELFTFAGQCGRVTVEMTYQTNPAYYIKQWRSSGDVCSYPAASQTTPFAIEFDAPTPSVDTITVTVCRWTMWEPVACGAPSTIYTRP
ncbi:hypothetical protein [Nonomuraea africana]|uniref:Secreted protein n=1 Tax=Nonomuraea africana TaxID=46171 RepID=A0ABR9KJW0_9ACTN|nr:hypothetical protein [Nonomuraea africana]MBE1562255.1 hypothetical protein [Nonomuraea africana]